MSDLPVDLIYFERSNNKKQNFDLGKVRARVDLAHPRITSLNF